MAVCPGRVLASVADGFRLARDSGLVAKSRILSLRQFSRALRLNYNSSESMALNPGTKLGPYEIQSLVGAGGMGEVYCAHDARLDRTVAIKILPVSYSADRDRLQRLAQEARAAAALNHPNILSIFDIGDNRGAPYVASELLEGETLRDC